jgi:hypothetical protein
VPPPGPQNLLAFGLAVVLRKLCGNSIGMGRCRGWRPGSMRVKRSEGAKAKIGVVRGNTFVHCCTGWCPR